jgi:hypothetical protein
MELLRRNDPNDEYAYINLTADERISNKEWSDALSRNQHVKGITFCFASANGRNLDSLLQIVSARDILEEVKLVGEFNPPKLAARFLQSIQLNSAIHTVKLRNVDVSGAALARFLDMATSVTTLDLENCHMDASQQEQGMMDIAAAIQRNTWIRKLSLNHFAEYFLRPILSSLASNSSVKELEIRLSHTWEEAPDAVKHLLESTSTIEVFTLPGGIITGEEIFLPISQALINSESVTDINLYSCIFLGGVSTCLFKNVLQSKLNIRSLCMRDCNVGLAVGILSAEDFIHLLGPASSLRSFELSVFYLQDFGFSSPLEFKALLEAVEASQLESFSIGRITDQIMCQELISSIPKMQVRTLQFCLADSLLLFKPGLLFAVKTNSTLYSVLGEKVALGPMRTSTDLFEEDDNPKLKYYAARNKGFSQWIASSSSVPREAWPRALAVARVTGPGTVYHILQMLGNSVGPVEGKRKRKRPIRYAPS